jgi:hypothetical protein
VKSCFQQKLSSPCNSYSYTFHFLLLISQDFVASDATGNHKCRCSISPFHTYSPAFDFRPFTLSPGEEQPSFDATSDTGEVNEILPTLSNSSKKKVDECSSLSMSKRSIGSVSWGGSTKGAGNLKCVMEIEQKANNTSSISANNDSTISMGSDFSEIVAQAQEGPIVAAQLTLNSERIPASTATKASEASATSSLNYSASQASKNSLENAAARLTEVQKQPTPSIVQIEEENIVPAPSPPKSSAAVKPVHASAGAAAADLNRSSESSDSQHPNLAVPKKTAKKIQPLKPPPVRPPKAPRSRTQTSTAIPTTRRTEILKQHEQRLLQGGDFLNESGSATVVSSDDTDLAMKLLDRLEAANKDEELMEQHHSEDPPIALAVTSFTSSARIDPRAANSASSNSSSSAAIPQSCHSSSSATRSSGPYAACNTESDKSKSGSSSMQPAQAAPPPSASSLFSNLEGQAEYKETEYDEAAEVLTDQESEHENDQRTPKINYLYSQDKEFENSILSPSASEYSQNTKLMNNTHGSSRASFAAQARYRSDAINDFLEQGPCPKDCTRPEPPVTTAQTHDIVGPLVQAIPHARGHFVDAEADKAGADADDYDPTTEASTGPQIVSDEFLNMMTAGCTGIGGRQAISEKLVALEAGWSGFTSSVNEQMQQLEESWRTWNLDSLLKFSSPVKRAPHDNEGASHGYDIVSSNSATAMNTSTALGSTSVMTTPPSTAATSKWRQQTNAPAAAADASAVFAVECESDVLNAATALEEQCEQERQDRQISSENCGGVGEFKEKTPSEEDEVVKAVAWELGRSRSRGSRVSKDKDETNKFCMYPGASSGAGAGTEKKIAIEHEIPLSLQKTLADISMIEDPGNSHNNTSTESSPRKRRLETSREDSEGGKVVLDAAEWDPVEPSDADSVDVDLSTESKGKGSFFKHKTGTVLRSPTSVLVEI